MKLSVVPAVILLTISSWALADNQADCEASFGTFLQGTVTSKPVFKHGKTKIDGIELSHTHFSLTDDHNQRSYDVAVDNVFADGYDEAGDNVPAPLNGISVNDRLEVCGLTYPGGIHWVHTNCGVKPTPKKPNGFIKKIEPDGTVSENLEGSTEYCRLWGNAQSASFLSRVEDASSPVPLLAEGGKPVDWWFVFKFNTHSFPFCANGAKRSCEFGGTDQQYEGMGYSQQYVYASSADANLKPGGGCVGASSEDPVAATYGKVYHGNYNYVVWNDQFYDDPIKSKGAGWGHSKGMLAWDDAGNGVVMQVTTPSWPASGSEKFPRKTEGNTLGCIKKPDNVWVSQHFFALRLNKQDLLAVLQALKNASVVTDPSNQQIVHNGGPAEVRKLVSELGKTSKSTTYTAVTLSSGVGLISKPAKLHVPPWQLASASLNGVALDSATWWAKPAIPSTDENTQITCWASDLPAPGAVEIAKEGQWQGKKFSLIGGLGKDRNHAKFGISVGSDDSFAIFSDLNQQGALSGNCESSQNGRGGLFFVMQNKVLNRSIANLLAVQGSN